MEIKMIVEFDAVPESPAYHSGYADGLKNRPLPDSTPDPVMYFAGWLQGLTDANHRSCIPQNFFEDLRARFIHRCAPVD